MRPSVGRRPSRLRHRQRDGVTVFRRYNEGVWPVQVALSAVGFVAAVAAYWATACRGDGFQSKRWLCHRSPKA